MAQRKSPAEKLALLEKQRRQIDALIQQQNAKLKEETRKQDTRRKIIAGALALEHAGIDPAFGDTLNRLLHRYVVRPEERVLFDLPPLNDSAPPESVPSPQTDVAQTG